MDMPTSPERPRKRRAINACSNCRKSKVRCDGQRPCARCDRNDAECVFYTDAKDPNVLRIERLEVELDLLREEVRGHRNVTNDEHRKQFSPVLITQSQYHTKANVIPNAADARIITWEQARRWYQSFFSGSQFLVPIFCAKHDTLSFISSQSSFLLDAILSIGCRAEEGFNSPTYQLLQSRTRDHLTNLLIATRSPSIEDVQAIALIAAYSENGFVLIALALRFAMQLGLPHTVEQLIGSAQRNGIISEDEKELYRLARIWHGISNLELFFSLDGGKLPGTVLHTSSRKIRSLVNHPERTAVDIRLLSQVELNIVRADAYRKITELTADPLLPETETRLRQIIDDTTIELNLWLGEWTAIVSNEQDLSQGPIALQNLNIQREWAIMTLHLKVIARSGIENIDFMTDSQRGFVSLAKQAAARHLDLILQDSSSPHSSPTEKSQTHRSTYLSTFRWTLDYVWAKCTFSVLLVLKLAILLRDPVPSVISLLSDAHRVLEELKVVTVGHIAYFQILQTSIEKCDAALKEYVAQQGTQPTVETSTNHNAEDEFQGYIPNEFVFEWDFPGLNLKHMPLGWQDLFINIDSLF